MSARAALAVIGAGAVVTGFAAYRAFIDGPGAPAPAYAPVMGGSRAKLAALQAGRGQSTKAAVIGWGVNTLFDAIGGQSWDFNGLDLPGVLKGAGKAADEAGIGGLLDLIGRNEAPQGYNQVYGGSKIAPPKPLSTMTVREVLAWQDRSVASGSRSSAAGRYQVIRSTLRDQVRAGVVSMDDRYSPATQDKIALALMRRRGLDLFRAGSITGQKFADNLAKEWASLPAQIADKQGRAARGQSYYAGDGLNKSGTDKRTVLDVLRGVL